MKITLGELISVGTGVFMAEDFSRVHEILDHMTQDKLFTHQLPRACRAVSPVLKDKYPFLKEINLDGITPDNYKERLNDLIRQYGNEFEVEPISNWQSKNPLVELAEMRGKTS